MKGSLVVRKRDKYRSRPHSGIVLSEKPVSAPSYSNDFLDCHRRVYEYDTDLTVEEFAGRRLQQLMVEVYWSHNSLRSWHRMSELDFLRLVS